jgi:N6-adenosine-specific RNA methylase IME4
MNQRKKERAFKEFEKFPFYLNHNILLFNILLLYFINVFIVDPPWLDEDENKPKEKEDPKDDIPKRNKTFEIDYTYNRMTDDQIKSIPFEKLTHDHFMFLWITEKKSKKAEEIWEKWGYEKVDRVIWEKNPALAHYTLRNYEMCILLKKGKPEYNNPCGLGIFKAKVDSKIISTKPQEIFEYIFKLYPDGYYCEVFGRKHNLNSRALTIGEDISPDFDEEEKQMISKIENFKKTIKVIPTLNMKTINLKKIQEIIPKESTREKIVEKYNKEEEIKISTRQIPKIKRELRKNARLNNPIEPKSVKTIELEKLIRKLSSKIINSPPIKAMDFKEQVKAPSLQKKNSEQIHQEFLKSNESDRKLENIFLLKKSKKSNMIFEAEQVYQKEFKDIYEDFMDYCKEEIKITQITGFAPTSILYLKRFHALVTRFPNILQADTLTQKIFDNALEIQSIIMRDRELIEIFE